MVDLHGQHEHQSLLRSETHVDMVDDFGGLEGLVREFDAAYHAVKASLREHHDLQAREEQLRDKRSLYEFQAGEIDALTPRAGEEDDLEAELLILENAEKLYAATERLHQMLYEGENAIVSREEARSDNRRSTVPLSPEETAPLPPTRSYREASRA
jgi:DNA repair protein RecN (Recombination protein N)